MNNSVLLKRPVITIFIFYTAFLLFLNALGIFEPSKQSYLYKLSDYKKIVSLEGKIISEPEKTKNGKRFILETYKIDDFEIKEKVLMESPGGYKMFYGDIINVEGRIYKPKNADFPKLFDYADYLARQNIYTVFKISSFEHIKSSPNPVKKLSLNFRKDIIVKIDKYFKKTYAEILKSVIIGDKSSLEPQTKENFIDAGLMHILVVSGLHVGFVGGMILLIFKLFGLSLRKASLISIPFIFIYVLASGANPPALRAAIMFSCVLISLALDREPLIYNSLALSALIILLFRPQQLFTASFQMSYAATIGIIYFYGHIFRFFGNIKNFVLKFFAGVFAVTVSAQIMLIPVSMYYFGKVSLISFITNILVVPLVAVITPLGFVFYFFTFISSLFSSITAWFISILLRYIIAVVGLSSSLPFAAVLCAKPEIFEIILFFIFLFTAFHFKNSKCFLIPGICLFFTFLLTAVPNYINRNKIIFRTYSGYNITTLHIKNRNINSFILYQKSKKYDKYYIKSFSDFLSFSGIKNSEISMIAFNDKEEIENSLKNQNLIFIDDKNKGKIHLNFYDTDFEFDMKRKKLFENGKFSADISDGIYCVYDINKKQINIVS